MRQRSTTVLWLDLLARAQDDADAGATPEVVDTAGPEELRALLGRRLRRWHRAVAIEPDALLALGDASRHRLRRRVERLRYALALVAPLAARKARKTMRHYLKRLRQLHVQLAALDDLAMTESSLRSRADGGAKALVSADRLSARRRKRVAACAKALGKLPAKLPTLRPV
jgi:CHAD domain-containing protein